MNDDKTASPDPKATALTGKPPKLLGMNPFKVLFAMAYVQQGLANPFQGITFQSFFKHFKVDYGLNEAQTQSLFSQSYLAWSFKPIIGFLVDAYGRTRTILAVVLIGGAALYFCAPFLDTSHRSFFLLMFILSVLFACADVTVDRATVIAGNEEARTSGRSKSTAVGLNQAICWAAIYGTSIFSSYYGGWCADNMDIKSLLKILAIVPLAVALVVLRLPRDKAVTIPIKQSVANFWNGLNTGPIMWVVLFYFLFKFTPALGAIWLNYCIETLKFTQTQVGRADSLANFGYFIGVLIFAKSVVKLQDRFGLRSVFRFFIILGLFLGLSSYLFLEPRFSAITGWLHGHILPGCELASVRLGFYAGFNCLLSIVFSIIAMSTFSLVGAIIPSNAAGALFAGFMSVSNLAVSMSYSSGSWLYSNGMKYGFVRDAQNMIFGIGGSSGDNLSMEMLVLIGAIAGLSSLSIVHMLPDKKHTQSASDMDDYMIGPEHFKTLGSDCVRRWNGVTAILCILLSAGAVYAWNQNVVAAVIIGCFIPAFFRKLALESRYHAGIQAAVQTTPGRERD